MRLLYALIAMLVASFAHADEVTDEVRFDVMLGPGAIICDKAESVILAFQGPPPSDCGTFRTRTGSPVTVTIIGEYQGPTQVHPLARFEFHTPTPWGNDIQYGWWAGELPEPVPKGVSL